MKRVKSITSTMNTIAALIFIACALAAGQSKAQENQAPECKKPALHGMIIGVNAGFGGNTLHYQESNRSIFEKPQAGGMGGLRFGYALSPQWALSLENFGFGGIQDDDTEWGVGASFLSGTWHPGGNGFFLRAGVGLGGGTILHPETDQEIELRDHWAGLFSIGYDWRIGKHTTLGLSADSMTIDAGGSTGFEDDQVGSGGLTLQFNWYL